MKCSRTLAAIVCRDYSCRTGKRKASETKPRGDVERDFFFFLFAFVNSLKMKGWSKKRRDFSHSPIKALQMYGQHLPKRSWHHACETAATLNPFLRRCGLVFYASPPIRWPGGKRKKPSVVKNSNILCLERSPHLKKKKKKKKETTTFCWNKTHFEAGKSGRLMLLIQENQTFLFIVLSTYPSLIVPVNFAGFVIERGKNHHGHGSQFKSSQFGISFSFPFFRSFFFLLLWHEKQATSWGEPEAYCGAGHCWLDERRIQVTFLIELFCVRFSALHSLSSVARDNRWGWNSFSAILPCPDEQY